MTRWNLAASLLAFIATAGLLTTIVALTDDVSAAAELRAFHSSVESDPEARAAAVADAAEKIADVVNANVSKCTCSARTAGSRRSG